MTIICKYYEDYEYAEICANEAIDKLEGKISSLQRVLSHSKGHLEDIKLKDSSDITGREMDDLRKFTEELIEWTEKINGSALLG